MHGYVCGRVFFSPCHRLYWCCHRPPFLFLFWFLWPPKASSCRQDVGLLRDLDRHGGGGGLEEKGEYRVLSFSLTTDLWGLSPSVNICLSPVLWEIDGL